MLPAPSALHRPSFTASLLLHRPPSRESSLSSILLTSVTGDHLITKEEIVAFCEKNPDALSVLGVESVDALMRKFDEDGSGQLDEDELKQLRAYINTKRKENQMRIRELQQEARGAEVGDHLRPGSGRRMVRSALPLRCLTVLTREEGSVTRQFFRYPKPSDAANR